MEVVASAQLQFFHELTRPKKITPPDGKPPAARSRRLPTALYAGGGHGSASHGIRTKKREGFHNPEERGCRSLGPSGFQCRWCWPPRGHRLRITVGVVSRRVPASMARRVSVDVGLVALVLPESSVTAGHIPVPACRWCWPARSFCFPGTPSFRRRWDAERSPSSPQHLHPSPFRCEVGQADHRRRSPVQPTDQFNLKGALPVWVATPALDGFCQLTQRLTVEDREWWCCKTL